MLDEPPEASPEPEEPLLPPVPPEPLDPLDPAAPPCGAADDVLAITFRDVEEGATGKGVVTAGVVTAGVTQEYTTLPTVVRYARA